MAVGGVAGWLGIAAVLVHCASPALARQQSSDAEEREVRSFSIPDALYARTLYTRAIDHVAAGRFVDAISDLQHVLEDHRGAVLGPRERDSAGRTSQQPVHPGAATSARELLAALPPQGRKLYRDRYEAVAEAALENAIAAHDRAALSDVARRYPITQSAERAWVALGDLELELGNLETACAAWNRAAELAGRLSDSLQLGELRSALLERAGASLVSIQPDQGELGLYDGTQPIGPLPGPDCHSWRRRFSEESQSFPFNNVRQADFYNLFPVLVGDTLLVSTSLRMLAYNAYSGALRWKSDEPPGWREIDERQRFDPDGNAYRREDFFTGLNREALMIAPAARGAIVVAALQIPVTQLANTNYQNITITKVLPDRRLFAYDLASGQPLWNHLPPPLWDGESGNFAERMRVAGPPVIAGSRVLVPAYRLQGRYEFAIGCYDLYDGALLWSTALISGQLELNMFGRQNRELCAPPLEVAGERVIALTQLGSVAALDLFTGEIMWETLYDQIPLPQAEGFSASMRDASWRNSPPVVSGGVVVAAPTDSEDLIGIDLVDGTLLWSKPQKRVVRGITRRNLFSLLGAVDQTVYLGGGEILALRATAGLASTRGPSETTTSDSLLAEYNLDSAPAPRALLTAEHVVVATSQRRLVLDRKNLHSLDSRATASWGKEETPGNLVLGRGALYALSGRYLTGLLDWASLGERLEEDLAADPNNADVALGLVDFLTNRADIERSAGRTARALDYLERARTVIEPFATADAGRGTPPRTAVAGRLHAVLVGQAACLIDLADPAQALARLEQSRAFAGDARALSETLLALAALQRDRDRAAWIAILLELDRSCSEVMLAGPHRDSLEARTSDDLVASSERPLEVGRWVQRELANAFHRSGELDRELEALHTLLARYGNIALDTEPGPGMLTVADRIGEIVGPDGAAGLSEYAPWEARARTLLDDARTRADLDDLARVGALYPHSQAAREAQATRLDLAFEAGDAASFAADTLSTLPERWTPARASDLEARRLMRMSRLFREIGAEPFADELARQLARLHPDLVSDLPDQSGKTFSQLAPPAPDPDLAPAERANFDSELPNSSFSSGTWNVLGVLPPWPNAPEEPAVLVCSTTGYLVGYFGDRPSARAWNARIDARTDPRVDLEHVALLPRRAVVALGSDLIAYEGSSGEEVWRTTTGGARIRSLAADAGVVVIVVARSDNSEAAYCYEGTTGTALWYRELPASTWSDPVVGDGRAVFLPKAHGQGTAWVIDLATGKIAAELDFPQGVLDAEARGAWIQDGMLVVPGFGRSPSDGAALGQGFDLERGARAWSLAPEPDRELFAVARYLGTSYWVLSGSTSSARSTSGVILELDARMGAVRTLPSVRLPTSDFVIGLDRYRTVTLDGPFLFVRSPAPGDKDVLIRAIHLPYGERWTYRLTSPEDSPYNASMPLPALSRTTVAIVFTELARARGRGPERTNLLLLDRSTGQKRDHRTLAGLGRADGIELFAFGSGLIITGGSGDSGGIEILDR